MPRHRSYGPFTHSFGPDLGLSFFERASCDPSVQVLSEVYCSAQPQNCKVHVMLCLVMNKMVDPQQEVRKSTSQAAAW